MGFFSNKSITHLNLSNSFFELMTQIANVFAGLFLYQHGFSLYEVFFTLGGIALGRICMRFLALPLIHSLGLRRTVMIGLLGNGTAILMLSQVQKADDIWFALYLVLYTAFNSMYWLAFHVYYTLQGSDAHRGKQYAVRNAFILSWQALFPILSAFVINNLGYHYYFMLAVPIAFLAFLPLLKCQDTITPVKIVFSRNNLLSFGVRSSIFSAIYDSVSANCWVFMVYLYFNEKMLSFGSILTFGIVVQILWQIFIGRHVDKGKTLRISAIGGMVMSCNILGRSLLSLSLPVIMLLEFAYAIGKLHLNSVKDVVTYNESHATDTIISYWLFTEMTRDTGNIIGTLSVAFLLYKGFALHEAIAIALPAVLMLWYVLTRSAKVK